MHKQVQKMDCLSVARESVIVKTFFTACSHELQCGPAPFNKNINHNTLVADLIVLDSWFVLQEFGEDHGWLQLSVNK